MTALLLAAPPPPLTTDDPTLPAPVAKAVEAAQKTMKAELLKATPKATIEVRRETGPFDTVIAVAADPTAYPGTGVMRTVIDAKTGTTYGVRGKKTFADFARAHGWLTQAPSSDELVMFLNLALFDGIAILDRESGESIDVLPEGLKIVVVRRFMPSNAGERYHIMVGKTGAETITKEAMKD